MMNTVTTTLSMNLEGLDPRTLIRNFLEILRLFQFLESLIEVSRETEPSAVLIMKRSMPSMKLEMSQDLFQIRVIVAQIVFERCLMMFGLE